MSHVRRLPKIAPTGRVAVRLSPAQRDQVLNSRTLPRKLGHLLHRAPVREGKLEIRVSQPELEALITSAAGVVVSEPAALRALDVFLDYLETQADRFAERAAEAEYP